MGVQEWGYIMDAVRSIFAALDGVVYGLIKWILFGIFDLANLTTNSEVFSGIYSRIYVVLGIFMAFKLSFSFFQYIMDPESMTGKSDKSLSKLFTRVFIMLVALIFLPTILFGQNGQEGLLSRAQRAFLPTLPKLIFGVDNIGGLSNSGDGSAKSFSDSIEQAADDIALTTLSGFFRPPEDLDDYCDDGTYDKTPQIKSIDFFRSNVNATCPKRGDIVSHVDFTGLVGTKFYKYSYLWFVSTIVGVLIALLLLGITLDIAKRIFKLLILEVVAPVPIMSLIDPKGSKDGAFAKWSKSLISTFLDIFFKLGLVYLIVVFIHMIVNSGNSGGLFTNFPSNTGFRGTYLIIILILGLIFFAKEAPKFIKEAIGLKGDGGGLFDDVKSLGKAAGLVGGAAVGTAGIVGSAVTNYRAAKEENEQLHPNQKGLNIFRNAASSIAGAIGGAAVGTKALFGKNGGIKAVSDAQSQRNARRAAHSTPLGRLEDSLYGIATGRSLATRDQQILDSNKAAAASIKSFKSVAVEEAMKKGDYGFVNKKKDRTGNLFGKGFNYRNLQQAMEAKDSSGNFSYEYDVLDANGNKTGTTATGTFNVAWFDPNTMAGIEDSQTDGYLVSNWGVRSDGTTGFINDKINTEWQNARHDMNEANINISGDYLGQSSGSSRLDSSGEYITSYGDIGTTMGKANKTASDMSTDMRRIKHRANKQNKK